MGADRGRGRHHGPQAQFLTTAGISRRSGAGGLSSRTRRRRARRFPRRPRALTTASRRPAGAALAVYMTMASAHFPSKLDAYDTLDDAQLPDDIKDRAAAALGIREVIHRDI